MSAHKHRAAIRARHARRRALLEARAARRRDDRVAARQRSIDLDGLNDRQLAVFVAAALRTRLR